MQTVMVDFLVHTSEPFAGPFFVYGVLQNPETPPPAGYGLVILVLVHSNTTAPFAATKICYNPCRMYDFFIAVYNSLCCTG